MSIQVSVCLKSRNYFVKQGLSRVRVSSGYLCNAEAPTEPTGETASPYNSAILR